MSFVGTQAMYLIVKTLDVFNKHDCFLDKFMVKCL